MIENLTESYKRQSLLEAIIRENLLREGWQKIKGLRWAESDRTRPLAEAIKIAWSRRKLKSLRGRHLAEESSGVTSQERTPDET